MCDDERLLILERGHAISMTSFQDSTKEFRFVPFLGFHQDYAGVGYVDVVDGHEMHVISSCFGRSERTMPIIRAWRALQIIQRLDLLKTGMCFQVWDFVMDRENVAYIQELASTGAITPSWCEEVMNSLPSSDFLVNIATQTILAHKWFDNAELRHEHARLGKEVPAIINAYTELNAVIVSQDAALNRINHSVMMEMKGVNNPF